MIKVVFFDLHNTLIRYDPPREELQLAVFREHGLDTDIRTMCAALSIADAFFYQENMRSAIHRRPEHEKLSLYEEYENIVLCEAGFDVSEETALSIMQKLHAANKKFVYYDDVLPTFDILRNRGLKLGLITNAEPTQSPFEELDLYEQLDYIITSPDESMGKPSPHIFWAALRKAGARASEAIHAGDQYEIDVVGAEGVGIKALLLDRNSLFDGKYDCPRINSLAEIINYL